MLTRDLDAFVGRDWSAVREAKDRYWADRIARFGPAEGMRIADELRRQARMLDPSWPRPEDRREDLAAHARLAEAFRRGSATSRR